MWETTKTTDRRKLASLICKENSLHRSFNRLKKKYSVQRGLLKVMQRENQLNESAKLSKMDGALEELIINEGKNRWKLTSQRYSKRVKALLFPQSVQVYAYNIQSPKSKNNQEMARECAVPTRVFYWRI